MIEVKKAQGQKCERCWKILEKKCERENCPIKQKVNILINVKEIKNSKLSKYLSNFADNSGMKYKKYNLEFFGLCRDCKLKQ